MQIRQWWRFLLKKTSPSPTLSFCMKICRQISEALLFLEYFDQTRFCGNFRKFFKTSNAVRQVDKICSRILWTWPCWHTCPGWYCNPQLLRPWTSTNSYMSPLPFLPEWFFRENFLVVFKGTRTSEQCRAPSLNLNRHCLSRWKLRMQLIVVSSLFDGNPFVDGILDHNLLLSRAFSVGIPSWMGL
jgi:hypothetical protein